MIRAGRGQSRLARQRRRGESVAGCLFAIALAIGGIIWGYFKFVHWGPIVNADSPKSIVTFNEKDNWPAYLEYGRRFRDTYSYNSRASVTNLFDLIRRVKKGEGKADPSAMDQKLKEYQDKLLASVGDLNGQQVPNRLKGSHIKLARSYRLCYEAVLVLRQSVGEEGAERDRLVKEADTKAKQAWSDALKGISEHENIWRTTGTI